MSDTNFSKDIMYSIIIPHKNVPNLLARCLKSIPPRTDTQVIVVDDNSSEEIVDFSRFPGQERQDVKIILTKEGKGPGYARNVGIENALGKWILFIDADDFFTDSYNELLDSMGDRPEDIIFFSHISVMSDDISISAERCSYLNMYIDTYLKGNLQETDLRYNHDVPIGKIIRKSLLDRNNIRYREVRWAEDCLFTARLGCHAKTIYVSDFTCYVVTVRQGSLTSNFCQKKGELLGRLVEAVSSERYIQRYIGDKSFEKQDLKDILNKVLFSKGRFYYIISCLHFALHPRVAYRMVVHCIRKLRNM